MDRSSSRRFGRQQRLEMAFLEAVHRRCGSNRRVWEALGELYTRAGRFEDGLAMDLRLAAAFPKDPMVLYNLACSYALTGRRDDALNTLSQAVRFGYADADWMMRDGDLQSIRDDPRFRALVRRIQRQRTSSSSSS